MSRIVTKKARFMLEADGFSIHTFEISRKLTRKRTRRRQASTTSITSSFNSLIIYDKTYQMTNQGLRVDYEDLLRKIHKLGLSPIPLRKNFCAQQIPGPVSSLRMISVGEIVISCQKVK